MFSFCMCKNVETEKRECGDDENKSKSYFTENEIVRLEEGSRKILSEDDVNIESSAFSNTKKKYERESSFANPEHSWQHVSNESQKAATENTVGGGLLHVSTKHTDFNWAKSSEVTDLKTLHDLERKKRVQLRKLHAKLKLDLKHVLIMRENLESSKMPIAANLPDVVAAESNVTQSDFLREFRQIYDMAMSDVVTAASELKELSDRYKDLSYNKEASKDNTDKVKDEESYKVANDSEKIVTMLKKAMKIATVEHKLKVCLADETSGSESQSIEDLETALLELQRLKSSNGLKFTVSNISGNENKINDKEFAARGSIEESFMDLFPIDRIFHIEKEAKLKLAELHIQALDTRYRHNDAKQQLSRAIERRNELELHSAIQTSKDYGLSPNDEVRCQAERLLSQIIEETQKSKERLREGIDRSDSKVIQQEMRKLESLNISKYDTLILEGERALKDLGFKEEELKIHLKQLSSAMKKKNADDIQKELVLIKSIKVNTDTSVVEEATNLLAYLRRNEKEKEMNALESCRLRLVDSLDAQNTNEIAEALVEAQTMGLSNCVEIMGARTMLSQLQNNKEKSEAERKKIEEYLEKLCTRAADNNATADLIMTMERAVAVSEKLIVSPDIIQRAREGLDELKVRKEKVKKVKDDLQRAVMECRHESITCAIAEAECLPYFLTFDPLDGQISAILEYAKNKIAPHNSPSITGEGKTSVQRMRSNLKRSMKGHSSKKLESAISIYRKAFAIPENTTEQKDADSLSIEDEENASLLRRAERRCRRMKRQEKIAEKEWKNMRETLRGNLKSALKERDRAEIWKAVYQFKRELGSSLNKDDEALLIETRRHLKDVTVSQLKDNLRSALKDRDCVRLKHSLNEIDSPPAAAFPLDMDVTLKEDIERARKLLTHLREMDKLKKSVSEMSRSQIAEIHRYPSPPACVRDVMTATYILLGENEKVVKEWNAVLRLMVKMGRESLTRRVAICNPNHILPTTAQKAHSMLVAFSLQQVQDVSKGAAVFFAWTKSMIVEVMDRHKYIPTKPTPQKVITAKDKSKDAGNDAIKSEFWNRLSRPRSSASTQRSVRAVRLAPRPTSAIR